MVDRSRSNNPDSPDDPNQVSIDGFRLIRIGATPTGTAVVWVDRIAGPTLGWTKIRTKYNAEWLESMKLGIHPMHRRWVPDQKVWAFHPDAVETIINITLRYFPKITKLESDPFVDAALPPEGTEGRVATLVEEIDRDRAAAVEGGILPEFGKRKVEV